MPPQFEEFNEIGDAFESMGSSGYSSRWRLHPDRYFQPGITDPEARTAALLDNILRRTSCSGGGRLIISVVSPQVWQFECPPGEQVVTEYP